MQSLHIYGTDSIIKRIDDSINRFVTSAIRLIKKSNATEYYGLSLLLILISNRNPSLLVTNFTQIRQTCLQFITHPILYNISTEILAISFSSDSHESWNNIWSLHCIEAANVLEALGVYNIYI
jgi:hypothetical protein